MGKIRLVIAVDCDDEHVAAKIQDKFNLVDIMTTEGVFRVGAEWLAERETPDWVTAARREVREAPDAEHPERQDPNWSAP